MSQCRNVNLNISDITGRVLRWLILVSWLKLTAVGSLRVEGIESCHIEGFGEALLS